MPTSPSDEDIAKVIAAVVQKVKDSDNLEDIAKAVAIAKAGAKTEKTRIEAVNQGKKYRLELFQSISALLVPAVSLLALVTTVAVQAYQIHLQNVAQVAQEPADRIL